jgi:hypothetical protein
MPWAGCSIAIGVRRRAPLVATEVTQLVAGPEVPEPTARDAQLGRERLLRKHTTRLPRNVAHLGAPCWIVQADALVSGLVGVRWWCQAACPVPLDDN